ncbi:11-beta-hydroxysteroid dehydrogenase 1B-like [Dorcoceras hygrometricum]|uniref:11-beta-hydroxysteroid dehydrogenase 1B-like n=1 Tax=Dorcoceras hygrometricum TaxID=472368 RepID=A0A2Z7CKR3_9LAMI|nr:11-beta-hydroxysteroid dehydrogenase 1B-like [Dorcoceras hygrometricum]
MDLVNLFLNVFAPIFTFNAFLFLFPVYLFFRSLRYIFRSIFRENVAGKVVVIAGASSGIGEHLAYEYGRRGAYLVVGARREKALRDVAETARWLGSPLVIPIRTDISKVEDCRRLIEEAISNFGRLDHLVIPAGITPACMFEDTFDVTNFKPAMDINFWGPVYTTYFAAPYLRMTKGKIVAIASSNSWLNAPRLSYYNASKAAVVSFFETMRVEFGSDIGITIVMPGLVESEMTKGKILSKDGKVVVDQEMRDVVMSAVPIKSVGRCSKEIVNSVCRGDKYLVVPSWFRAIFFFKMMCPEAVDWFNRWFCITEPETMPPMSQKITKFPGLKDVAHPDSVRSPKIKT